MAEGVLFDFVGNIVASLASQAIQEIGLASNVGKDVEKLKNKLSAVKVVLLDAEEQHAKNDAVKDWLRRLKDAVYDADDVVDEFQTEALRRQVEIHGSKIKEVKNFFSRSNPVAFCLKMGHRIKEISENLDVIASDMARFQFRERLHDTRPIAKIRREETHSFIPESTVIGREQDKKKIVELLLEGPPDSNLGGGDGVHHHHHPADQNVGIIPIVGIGGLGKTTLAQLVYNDQSVAEHFKLRMWVCVSDEFDVKLLTQKIIRCANSSDIDCSNKEMEQLQAILRKSVDGRRYLLVLDDVWNDKAEKWNKLKELLMGGCVGSKILVTTRSKKVAKIMGTVGIEAYHLEGLNEEECWELFKQRAFEQGHEPDPKLVEIGKEIVKKCKGVPLAAKSLGSLMRFKTQESEWLYVKNNEIWRIEGDDDDDDYGEKIVRVLRLSYDHLPSKLKQCFAYCSIFPKDHKIKKKTLIQLWMAQGFIGSYEGCSSSSERRRVEEIGEEYFNDLLWRCMFQEAKEDEEGNIVSCKMHDLVHDLAQSVAGVECFRIERARDEEVAQPPTITIPEGVRHVALLDHGGYNSTNGIEFWSQLKLSNKVRTLLLPHKNYDGMRLPIEGIVNCCACLRVLDLHGTSIESLQISSIGELKHLRYLDLSYNLDIETLPTSITKLQNLQTMKVRNCEVEKLPEDIGNMKSLRHVDLSWNWTIKALPASTTKLENLHTLNLSSCHLEELPEDIGKLENLHTLGLGDCILENFPVYLRTLTKIKRIKGLGLPAKHIKELHGLHQHLSGTLSIGRVEQMRDGKEANLKEMPYLSGLELIWNNSTYGKEIDDNKAVEGEENVLEGLQPHPNLKELKLRGYGGMKFASWMIKSSLLPNLVTIVLEDCPRCESLEFSGPLPSLEALWLSKFISLKSITSKLRKGDGLFPSLKHLNLMLMPKLESWSVVMEILDGDQEVVVVEEEEPHNSLSVVLFPHLPNECEIINCPKLESIPWGWPARERVDLCLIDAKALELVLKKKTKKDKTPIPLMLTSSSSSSTTNSSSSSSSSSFQHFLPTTHVTTTSLQIHRCYDLQSFPSEAMEGLTSIRFLHISSCHQLTSLHPQAVKQSLADLEELQIESCPIFHSLEGIGGLSALKALRIRDLPKLVAFPEELGDLKSLRKLHIENCRNLSSLPQGMRRLTELQILGIQKCPKLKKRCATGKGKDWPKISHVPDVKIQ